MKTIDIENAIIARLKSLLTGLHIQGFAQNADEFAVKHPAGAALVMYGGSSFTTPSSLAAINQDRKMAFDIILLFKNLRTQDGGHTGAYDYLDDVRKALTGYRIAGCSKMYPTRDDFIDEESGVWRYGMTFELLADNVEQ
jgi:hypothetical protein